MKSGKKLGIHGKAFPVCLASQTVTRSQRPVLGLPSKQNIGYREPYRQEFKNIHEVK